MKTQLLEDIGENGSGPGAHAGATPPSPPAPPPPPAPPSRPDAPQPAVWHRAPQRQAQAGAGANAQRAAHPGSMQRAPHSGPAPGPHGAGLHDVPPAAPPAPPRASHGPRTAHTGERAPFAAASTTAPDFSAGAPPTMPGAAPLSAEPDWLTAHLRRTATQQPEAAAAGSWTRRAFGWSLGLSLLAAVVAAGLWIYEDRRVDGALVVVANTGTPPASVAVLNKPALPAPAPAPLPAADAPETAPPVTPAPEDARTVKSIDITPPKAAMPAPQPKPRPRRTHRTGAAPAQTSADANAAEPSPRQRREEMLMQCRAHGYDERECVQRGCEMTRFGFACPG